jgi:hypothetical protein
LTLLFLRTIKNSKYPSDLVERYLILKKSFRQAQTDNL